MQQRVLPMELEAPPVSHIIAGAIWSVIAFFSMPFLIWRISEGYYDSPGILAWFEIAFHILNFVICFKLFREYLEDSLLNMQINRDSFINTVAIASGLILVIGLGWHFAWLLSGYEPLELAAFGAIPITELDILVLSGDAAISNPVFSIVCMATITPVVTGCLFYAIGFTPFYNIHPVLGYAMVCIATAFPRVCCAGTWWVPEQQVMLYIAQLPIHLVCCWAYRKTDTVWAPIITQLVTNLLAGTVLAIVY